MITWTNSTRKLSELIPWPRNPRQIKGEQVKRLQESWELFGQPEVIAIGPASEVYNGHQRLKAWAEKFGDVEVAVRVASRALTEKEREKLTVFLHRGTTGEWDFDTLANEFEVDELVEWGFEPGELGIDTDEQPSEAAARQTLAQRFIVPPFSVLDARQGYWQERKRAWLALGIKSELGRGDCITWTGDAITEPGLNHYRRINASPSGSPRDAATLGPDGKTRRGDGRGRVIERERERERVTPKMAMHNDPMQRKARYDGDTGDALGKT